MSRFLEPSREEERLTAPMNRQEVRRSAVPEAASRQLGRRHRRVRRFRPRDPG
jgi:hypothetical protein